MAPGRHHDPELNYLVYGGLDDHRPSPSTVCFYNGPYAIEQTVSVDPTATPLPAEHTVVYNFDDLPRVLPIIHSAGPLQSPESQGSAEARGTYPVQLRVSTD